MKIDNKVVAAIILIIGYVKYKEFIDFIDNLKLGLNVQEIEDGYATIFIDNLNTRHIPYSFKSIDLIIDKTVHAASNTEKSTNLSIVPASQIPINFKMLYNLSKKELLDSEIAIKYSFYGFDFERLYKPKPEVNELVDLGGSSEHINFCSCNK